MSISNICKTIETKLSELSNKSPDAAKKTEIVKLFHELRHAFSHDMSDANARYLKNFVSQMRTADFYKHVQGKTFSESEQSEINSELVAISHKCDSCFEYAWARQDTPSHVASFPDELRLDLAGYLGMGIYRASTTSKNFPGRDLGADHLRDASSTPQAKFLFLDAGFRYLPRKYCTHVIKPGDKPVVLNLATKSGERPRKFIEVIKEGTILFTTLSAYNENPLLRTNPEFEHVVIFDDRHMLYGEISCIDLNIRNREETLKYSYLDADKERARNEIAALKAKKEAAIAQYRATLNEIVALPKDKSFYFPLVTCSSEIRSAYYMQGADFDLEHALERFQAFLDFPISEPANYIGHKEMRLQDSRLLRNYPAYFDDEVVRDLHAALAPPAAAAADAPVLLEEEIDGPDAPEEKPEDIIARSFTTLENIFEYKKLKYQMGEAPKFSIAKKLYELPRELREASLFNQEDKVQLEQTKVVYTYLCKLYFEKQFFKSLSESVFNASAIQIFRRMKTLGIEFNQEAMSQYIKELSTMPSLAAPYLEQHSTEEKLVAQLQILWDGLEERRQPAAPVSAPASAPYAASYGALSSSSAGSSSSSEGQ